MVTYPRTCSICGKTFMASRADAKICNTNSTCRVKAKRLRDKAAKEAQRLTINTDDYMLMQAVTNNGQDDALVKHLTNMLLNYGKSALHDTLIALQYVKGQ